MDTEQIPQNEVVEVPKKRRPKWVDVIINLAIIFTSLISLAVAGVLIYQKRYLTPFWVNGQSMYPTLNKNATHANGEKFYENGSSVENGSTWVDYGVMDKHDRALKKLKRFDIVVCHYKEDDSSEKIKRIVGLPGETIKFGQDNDKGQLYVKNGDSFTFVEQPVANEYIAAGDYPTSEITLGSNEYYVLGDNRGHSSDCRNVGPITYDKLVGKVVAICAHCEIKEDENANFEPVNIKHYFPRFL